MSIKHLCHEPWGVCSLCLMGSATGHENIFFSQSTVMLLGNIMGQKLGKPLTLLSLCIIFTK